MYPVEALPWLAPSAPAHACENLLAAVAAAWALNLTPDLILTGIATYAPDANSNGTDTTAGPAA